MIIGLTGSFGAGKGVVVDYLKQKGFAHFSARELIFEEARKRGLDPALGRQVTIPIGNALRMEHGPSYIIETLLRRAQELGGDAVVESVRAVAEARYIQEQGGFVLGVDANPRLRYERSIARGSETDHVTYEEWRAQELVESNPDDPTKQDIFGALAISDQVITNEGTLEELHEQIEAVLKTIHAD